MKSSATGRNFCLEGECLDISLAKSFIDNRDNFSPGDATHIESCPRCQKILEKARTDLAWHGR